MTTITKTIGAALLLACPPTVAAAGFPGQVEVTCPIGGEVFTKTTTSSCSRGGFGYTMSYRPLTSCDYVTQLPQCPGNGLPLYRDFDEAELARLEELMAEPAYAEARAVSRYYLAHHLRTALGEEMPGPVWLLVNGLWHDPDNTFGDPAYGEVFFPLARAAVAEGGDNAPYIAAVTAYALAHAGKPDEAEAMLAVAGEGPEDLGTYISAVRACLGDVTAEGCRPDDNVPNSGMWTD